MRRKLAAGNWKMNGTAAALDELTALIQAHPEPSVDLLICPPATLLARASQAGKGHALALGGQDCHSATNGAHTGDISAAMLLDAGASHVILGHSERRQDHFETSAIVHDKAVSAQEAGLIAVICIGETLAQREAGETLTVLADQLAGSLPEGCTADNTVVAYEPVWAIGTGLTATAEQIGEVHANLRAALVDRFAQGGDMRILYGGSVKAGNAAEIFGIDDVDGALVGGASLKASDFSPIVTALENA